MSEALFSAYEKLKKCLEERIDVLDDYRIFYGLIYLLPVFREDRKSFQKIVEQIQRREKELENSKHFEFNHAILLSLQYDFPELKKILFPRKYNVKNKTTNWTLLRCLCFMREKTFFKKLFGKLLSFFRLSFFQHKSGFIQDSSRARSLQYHCFCAAILADLYQETGWKFYKKRFLRAVDFVLPLIFENGQSLYVGRGQEQIFGYGALVYSLQYAFVLTGDFSYLQKQEKVLGYLISFQRPDGSFPLVLRDGEGDPPKKIDVNDPNYLGWYQYNNYYDYLPFLAYYLQKTIALADVDSKGKKERKDVFHDKNFIVRKNENYTAVLSCPGKDWSNDLPLPFLFHRGKTPLPMYGGEQYNSRLYSEKNIPLPWAEGSIRRKSLQEILWNFLRKSLREKSPEKKFFFRRLHFRWEGDVLVGENKNLIFRRSFVFQKKGVEIQDQITFKEKICFMDFHLLNIFLFDAQGGNGKYSSAAGVSLQIVEYPDGDFEEMLRLEKIHTPTGEVKNIILKAPKFTARCGDILTCSFRLALD
jgi:hypothetical protein